MTIVSQQGDRYSPYLLIKVPDDFWRLNTGCDHSIPTRRSLFTLSPNYSTRGFLEIEY
ncbi:hypothetical protein [Cylindrospermopsis raciborskii]|uniref:hypothetical protein n=1 Tax=Cylindrospermopsis raciborskii TaxID=77022 RepID=UPI00136519D5|nr:hypothetical protein [Cylindrospermopsis raciborskii]